MEKELIIIKFGGSIITDKDQPNPTPRNDVITQLATEVKNIYDTDKYDLILVHGAGSFAHPLVKRHSLHKGMQTPEQFVAYSETTYWMTALSQIISKSLLDLDIPVVTLPPHSFIEQSSAQLQSFDSSIIEKLLKNGQIPLLYGDLVLDTTMRCSVISGDTIIAYLAKKLNPEKVIFLTDVDGIFDADPKTNLDAKLIPEINNDNLDQVLEGITARNPHDVTGEMKGKILSIKDELTHTPVYIANGLISGNLEKITADNNPGTKIYFSK